MVNKKKGYSIFAIIAIMVIALVTMFVPNMGTAYATDTDTSIATTTLYWYENVNAFTNKSDATKLTLNVNMTVDQEKEYGNGDIYISWSCPEGLLYHAADSASADDTVENLSSYKKVKTIDCYFDTINSAFNLTYLPTPSLMTADNYSGYAFFKSWYTSKTGDEKLTASTFSEYANATSGEHLLFAVYKTDPGGVIAALKTFTLPLLIIVGTFGLLYAVILGINLAKADSADARDQAKKRMVNALIGLVVTVILLGLLFVYAQNYDVFADFLKGLFAGTLDK